jgi:hypothetical protein
VDTTLWDEDWKSLLHQHYKKITPTINFNKPITPQLVNHSTTYQKHDGTPFTQQQRELLTKSIKIQFFKNFFLIHQKHNNTDISFLKLPYSRTTPKPHNIILPLFEDNNKLGNDLYKFKYAITLPSSKLSVPGGGSDTSDPTCSFNATRETLEESNIFLRIDNSFKLARVYDNLYKDFKTFAFYKFLSIEELEKLIELSHNPAFFGELQEINLYPYDRKNVNGKTAALFSKILHSHRRTQKNKRRN